MDVDSLPQDGEGVRPRPRQARPDAWLKAIAPARDARVLAVAWLWPWAWLADLGAQAGRPVVLGHALARQALPGGQANHDPLASQPIAGLLRGGRLPPASVSPAALRATRDRLRRRMPLAHTRAELLAHVQNTNSQ